MDESLITIIGFIIGGLSIFIYGINLMSDGLKSIAGYHIREYIEKYTSNLFTSILVLLLQLFQSVWFGPD